MADIRNPFVPIRITGRNGLATTEEVSRIEDLIKNALGQMAGDVNKTFNTQSIAISAVANLTTGASSIPGRPGEDGEDGAMGAPGLTGGRGVDGQRGSPGQDGDEGDQGPPGLQGLRGIDGLRGPPGADGEETEPWMPGAVNTMMAKAWVSTPDPSVPYGVNMGALATGVIQQTTTAGVAVPSTLTVGSSNLVAGDGTGKLATLANLNWNFSFHTLVVGGAVGSSTSSDYKLFIENDTTAATFFAINNTSTTKYSGFALYNDSSAALTLDAGFFLWGSATAGVPAKSFLMRNNAGGSFNLFTNAGTSLGFYVNNVSQIGTPNADNGIRFQFNRTVASAAGLTWDNYLFDTDTLTLTGGTTTDSVRKIRIAAPTITDGSAVTVTKAATVSIAGAPTAAGSVTITTPLALDIESGAFAHHKTIGANYERVRAVFELTGFGTGWHLVSEKGPAGTAQDIIIDASVGNGILAGVSSALQVSGGMVSIFALGVAGSEKNQFIASIARASAAGMVLNAHQFDTTATISAATNITTATGVNAVVINRPVYDGNGIAKTISFGASLYIANAPLAQNSATLTNAYALWVDAGLSRFDGNGTHVFELPADATGNVSAATGRVPINIGGATKYLRYFND